MTKAESNFDHIAIIYNPISTGDAPAMAERLQERIRTSQAVIHREATLTPTQHAGHAQKLSEEIALSYKRPLIISVSGDGGYNEVVNGAMLAKERSRDARPVVAVVGAGNANDHRRVVRDENTSLVDLIKDGQPKYLDLLRLEVQGPKDFKLVRYAHSYIGLGITPQVAVELNKHELNHLQEIKIILKTFFKYRPFVVEHDGASRKIDSLIFANINEMGKVLKLDPERNLHDDQFEVIEFPHAGKLKLLYLMIVAAVKGLRDQPQFSEYSFKLAEKHPAQLDGEVEQLPAKASVTIRSIHNAIESLY